MGLISSALQIGKSALLSYQSALQVLGNNVANAGVEGYARQSVKLSHSPGVSLPEGFMPGSGVSLVALKRHIDEALEARLRSAISEEQQKLIEQEALTRIESLYNELTDQDLSSLLNEFFNAFEQVRNNPTDQATRGVAISAGQAVASELKRLRSELIKMHDQLNEQLDSIAERANRLAQQIADLNLQIVSAESRGQGAAASLRDQRDSALRELSELLDIQTVETDEGAVNVFVGGEPLVEYGRSRGLTTEQEQVGDRTVVSLVFADNGGLVNVTGGEAAGLVRSRDEHIYGQVQQIDSLAAALIWSVNRLHSEGQGLEGITDITGVYDVLDTNAALDDSAAGLKFQPVNGTFKIIVRNESTGLSQEYLIEVDLDNVGADDSLATLVSKINSTVSNVTASVTSDNRLRLVADDGFSFTFAEDSSGVLAALGLNVFFTGADARDIAVEQTLADNPQRLAAALNGQPGDGSNAGRLSSLAEAGLEDLGGASISQQWRDIVGRLAVSSAAARDGSEAAHNVTEALKAQREAISGVNLDEEAVSLMRFQRSFQAAARYVALVDELMSEMLSLVR